jgi:hypothetical protein
MTGPSSDRRSLLKWGATIGAVVGTSGVARGRPGGGKGPDDSSGGGGGFPPSGITEYGRSARLGNGEFRTFTSETPSGEPKYHGVELDRAALQGLPSAEDLSKADNRAETDKYRQGGQAALVHFKQSLQFFVPFPDAAATPFTFLALNWNPQGHYGGAGAWERPHFDVHFHMLDPATVDAVEGPQLPPYDTSNGEYTGGSPAPDPDGRVTDTNLEPEQLPEGYTRPPEPVADQRYIEDMGEHTAPADAPELPSSPGEPGDPEAFTNTLIQGFIGVGEDAQDPRLAFVEPMVTREYLLGVRGVDERPVPQPEVYPHDDLHPTRYSVRDVPSKDAIAITLQAFE